MIKTLSQAIMQKTKLRDKFLKDPTKDKKIPYTKQRNCIALCIALEKRKEGIFCQF